MGQKPGLQRTPTQGWAEAEHTGAVCMYVCTFFLFLISISSRGSGRRQENRGGFLVNFLSARNGRRRETHKIFPKVTDTLPSKTRVVSEIFFSAVSHLLEILPFGALSPSLSLGFKIGWSAGLWGLPLGPQPHFLLLLSKP